MGKSNKSMYMKQIFLKSSTPRGGLERQVGPDYGVPNRF